MVAKILILGNGASGKTSLAEKLKDEHFVLHLDTVYWKDGTYEHNRLDDFFSRVDETLNKEEWIIEGTPMAGFESRVDRSDMVVFLDIPFRICLYRLLKRSLIIFFKPKISYSGCPARINIKTILWLMKFNTKQKNTIMGYFSDSKNSSKLKVIKNNQELKQLLELMCPSGKHG